MPDLSGPFSILKSTSHILRRNTVMVVKVAIAALLKWRISPGYLELIGSLTPSFSISLNKVWKWLKETYSWQWSKFWQPCVHRMSNPISFLVRYCIFFFNEDIVIRHRVLVCAGVCMWGSVFMCPYVCFNVCVYSCETPSEGQSVSAFLCVCASLHCVTLTNASLRSPAVQGWLD